MRVRFFYNIIICILILVSGSFSYGQWTKIRGLVTDAVTEEPIPFVNISFPGTNIGCITDFNGEYFLETRMPGDSLMASYVGYQVSVSPVKKHVFQVIDFKLSPKDIQIDEIVVHAGENPANILFRKLVKNKDNNNPSHFNSYQYESYSKLEFDVTNVDEEFKSRKVFNRFQFIFDYIDTSAQTGKSYLPVFITETLSDYYYQKSPKKEKEVIKGSNISGVNNESITQFTGKMYQKINFYENYVDVFGKQFVSPLSDFGLLTYKYYLIDSGYIDGHWCYHMTFKPKRKQEFTFTGDFWVVDSIFAIKKIKARKVEDANINYVDDYVIEIEFQEAEPGQWFVKREDLFAEFNLGEKSTGIFGRKITSYRNIKLNPEYPDTFFSASMPQETIVTDKSSATDTAFWNDVRHEKLTVKEQNIYNMVDSIKDVPLFRSFVDIVSMLVNGYYVHGKFEYGPYFKTFSFNPIEGYRFRIGGRTSNDFSTKIMYNGHFAYGTKDERFKYGLGFLYMFNKSPRESAGFQYKNDIEQLGKSINAFTEDNILGSILSRNPNDNLLMVEEYSGHYEKEWFLGFSNKIHMSHRQINASENIPFRIPESQNLKKLTSFELTLNTRYALNEKFVYGEFERISLGSEFPVVNLDLTAGLKNIFGSDYAYYKVHLNVSHHFDFNPFGYMKYSIDAGRIWGQVPFPLLRLHAGNETYTLDPYAFNMMNYYEFASDKYASLYIEHKFQGRFLNKIPLIRKLKFREVVHGKALIGGMDNKNRQKIMEFPSTLNSLSKPYIEAGVGIENILKVFRIDALWRFSYLDHPDIEKFGLRASVQVIF